MSVNCNKLFKTKKKHVSDKFWKKSILVYKSSHGTSYPGCCGTTYPGQKFWRSLANVVKTCFLEVRIRLLIRDKLTIFHMLYFH